jgi:hypothetical protein
LTGVWGPATENLPAGTSFYPISFPIRLASEPTPVVVKAGQNKSGEGCSGSITSGGDLTGGIPVAASGKLCIYLNVSSIPSLALTVTVLNASKSTSESGKADTSGALIKVVNASEQPVHGMWAVTGN